MEPLTPQQVVRILGKVLDPGSDRSIVAAGFVSEVRTDGPNISLVLRLPNPQSPLAGVLQKQCEKILREHYPFLEKVDLQVKDGSQKSEKKETEFDAHPERIPGVRHVIPVASGKGGVGKSTVAVNLAAALMLEGHRVGVLDADICGPSVPIMLYSEEDITSTADKRIRPVNSHGLKTISIGYFADTREALLWRGPILQKVLLQFCGDVDWGELDYLIMDMPPGTGDIQLTLAQQIATDGAVVVTTPQDLALADVIRARAMFEKVKIPILGVVENMSGFACPGCGKVHSIFSSGGGRKYAERLGLPFLGAIPLEIAVRTAGDEGMPVTLSSPKSAPAQAFREIARALAARIENRASA
ncbi:MAG: Iron-sulfur cluster carrier protein [Myxococcota bacterium]|nr:Iron-sulfur cluster carrier protein [Myxococcota bacterium]